MMMTFRVMIPTMTLIILIATAIRSRASLILRGAFLMRFRMR
jgi:hypothetical protein